MMTSLEWAVLVWTIAAVLGVLVSGRMVGRRVNNLRRLRAWEGNGDRAYRIFLAEQDIRRAVINHSKFVLGAFVGLLFVAAQHTTWLERPPAWLLSHWVWLLAALMLLTLLNAVIDDWTLTRIRQMRNAYRKAHGHDPD